MIAKIRSPTIIHTVLDDESVLKDVGSIDPNPVEPVFPIFWNIALLAEDISLVISASLRWRKYHTPD